jgi:hypothetical protein
MKFDHIVGLGDSWMWGDELVDPALGDVHPVDHRNTSYRETHCFLGIIGHHYNTQVSNLGWPGGSLQLCIYNYIWWTGTQSVPKNVLFLVALTEASRMSWFNPRHVRYDNDPPWNRYQHNTWLRHHGKPDTANRNQQMDDWFKLSMLYDTLTDCQASRRYQFKQAVMFFEGQKQQHKLLQFNVSQQPCPFETSSLLWPNQSVGSFLDKEDFKPGGHPNEIGHQKLANHLISQIDML